MKLFAAVFVCACLAIGSEAIIGGQDANVAQFPSTVAIHAQSTSAKHFCAGTLLNAQWVLTAAQCVDGATTFTILLGSNLLEGTDPNRVQAATSIKYIHPDYDFRTLDHDIALLKMHMPVTFTSTIQPASLPTVALVDNMPIIAVGWGATSDQTTGPVNHLKYVDVTTIPNAECQLTYGSQITANMVCISGNYNEGTCTDDSGSPLYIVVNHHVWVMGVSSFNSANGCESTDPSGYARVFEHLDWINSQISSE